MADNHLTRLNSPCSLRDSQVVIKPGRNRPDQDDIWPLTPPLFISAPLQFPTCPPSKPVLFLWRIGTRYYICAVLLYNNAATHQTDESYQPINTEGGPLLFSHAVFPGCSCQEWWSTSPGNVFYVWRRSVLCGLLIPALYMEREKVGAAFCPYYSPSSTSTTSSSSTLFQPPPSGSIMKALGVWVWNSLICHIRVGIIGPKVPPIVSADGGGTSGWLHTASSLPPVES